MKINNIMPALIAENHKKFIDRYFVKGNNQIINTKRSLFIKDKSGYLIAVQAQIYVNY